jgi:hypothetical protein
MTIEKNSSPEENKEAVEALQASSQNPPEQKQCGDDHDCPEGYKCVNGTCVPE